MKRLSSNLRCLTDHKNARHFFSSWGGKFVLAAAYLLTYQVNVLTCFPPDSRVDASKVVQMRSNFSLLHGVYLGDFSTISKTFRRDYATADSYHPRKDA